MFDQLRPYQIEDANFLASRNNAALFNEQRTGKTPTTLYALHLKGCKRNLIICPTSALGVWQYEYMHWMNEPCQICVGTRSVRRKILENWTHGMVISYDMLSEHWKDQDYELRYILNNMPDAVVLDEAHRIRNHRTNTAQAIFQLRNTPVRYALTGTPAMNRAEDIWSILHFLYPHTFKFYWPFINEFFTTRQEYNNMGRRYYNIIGLNEKGKVTLPYILSQISRMRKRKDVMTWLPEKEYIHVSLAPNKYQLKYLDDLEKMWETENVVTIGTLDRLIRYRQICLQPSILDLEGGSPKTEWLLQYLKDYPERPTLVFSKFTTYLQYFAEVKGIPLIVGATPAKRRREICQQFQDGKINMLLLNIDAGKEALTLDHAEAVIFMDRYPPVGDLMQAEDRFVATTKDKADKDHLVYFVYLKGTYDEQINKLIAARESETEVINQFKHYMERRKNHGYRSKIP